MNKTVTISEQLATGCNIDQVSLENELAQQLSFSPVDEQQIDITGSNLANFEDVILQDVDQIRESSVSIEALQARDPVEWDSFIRRIEPWLDHLTASMSRKFGKPNDAEDVKQEIILRLYKNIDHYPPFQSPEWEERLLTTMARNLFKDKIKVMSSRLTDYLDEPQTQIASEVPDFASEVVEGIVSKAQFHRLMKELSTSDKKVLIMKYCLDYSLEEIALSEGISKTGALKTKLHRARTHARELTEAS